MKPMTIVGVLLVVLAAGTALVIGLELLFGVILWVSDAPVYYALP